MPRNPVRYTSGLTQDAPFQPLGMIGIPDPLFYSGFYDDFMAYVATGYTVTNTGNGTIAAAAGDGGTVLYTTNSSTPAGADLSSLQPVVANLTLDTTKKWAYGCRVKLSSASNNGFLGGLIQKTTTPFTVTDGVAIVKASGGTGIVVNVVSGSSTQATATIPPGALTPADNTFFDVAFAYDGKADILIYAGTGLFGAKPDQDRATLGPVARITGVGSLTLTAANLVPTLALQSGTASSKTMTADFFYGCKER